MKHISSNFVSGLVIFGLILFLACALFPAYMARHRHGPSFATQRIEQRRIVLKRVLDAGGWDALHRDCELLVINSHADNFVWSSHGWSHVEQYSNGASSRIYIGKFDNGLLPPAISNLQPRQVEFDYDGKSSIVQIELFGMHRTGGWDTPYYGLYVAYGFTNDDYVPSITDGPWKHINKIANSVFEVYQ